ncbi:MAG: DUF4258 domain-containing protein [Deltaproteobacteria bacterium]|nr:DUF4258 domain-containing protein [Deltaproteobacteria bacterium]
MNYELTQHASDVLREREIAVEWVERVLKNPLKVEPDEEDEALEHRLGKISEHGDRVLRVIVNTHIDPMRVITVYFDRALKGKL